MVTLSGSNYVRRSSAVDGNNSVRAVIHGMGIVYKGIDIEPKNLETAATYTLPGIGLSAPEPPDTDGADLKVEPSYAYGYLARVESINGMDYTDLIGRRDPAYTSSWSAEQKAAAIQPATLSELMLTEEGKLILQGWAQVNGGQGKHYWSIDKLHWYECTDGTFTDAEQEILDKATNEGNMKLPTAEKGRFEGLTIDLSKEEGDSFTVYVAVAAAGNGEKLLNYLTIEKVTRYAEETEAPTEEPTEEPTEAPTEEPTEEPTEQPTEEPTEAPTEAPTAAPETEPEKNGCGSAIGMTAAVTAFAAAAAVVLKKKD